MGILDPREPQELPGGGAEVAVLGEATVDKLLAGLRGVDEEVGLHAGHDQALRRLPEGLVREGGVRGPEG